MNATSPTLVWRPAAERDGIAGQRDAFGKRRISRDAMEDHQDWCEAR